MLHEYVISTTITNCRVLTVYVVYIFSRLYVCRSNSVLKARYIALHYRLEFIGLSQAIWLF